MTLAADRPRDGAGSRKHRLLAIDGGGIRGVIALEFLTAIEAEFCPPGTGRTLADSFDYIAGTSTGAIIAAGLSLGMSVGELQRFYEVNGPAMFDPAMLLKRLHFRFEDDRLAAMLREVMGAETTLGSDRLKTLLMMVLRNGPYVRAERCTVIRLCESPIRN